MIMPMTKVRYRESDIVTPNIMNVKKKGISTFKNKQNTIEKKK